VVFVDAGGSIGAGGGDAPVLLKPTIFAPLSLVHYAGTPGGLIALLTAVLGRGTRGGPGVYSIAVHVRVFNEVTVRGGSSRKGSLEAA